MAILAIESVALGQAKPYRIQLLKDGSSPPVAVHVGNIAGKLAPAHFGNKICINNLGVVGGMIETSPSSGVFHGFVWFPNTLGVSGFNFPQRRLLDIHPYAFPGGTSDHTIVNDIDAGRLLVGFKGGTIGATLAPGVGHAYGFALDLTTPAITAVDLHTSSGSFSVAFGVNDATTARIVGQTTEECPSSETEFIGAFQTTWSSGSGAGTMGLLALEDEGDPSRAIDIARSSSSFLAAGESNNCGIDVDTNLCTKTICSIQGCLEHAMAAMRWTSIANPSTGTTPSFEVLDGLETGDIDSGVFARGINDDGDEGGWGWVSDADPCPERAAFWNGSSKTRRIPGNEMPSGQCGQRSWAEAISPRDSNGCVTLVGFNLTLNLGLIWHGFDDAWCAEDLNNLVLPCGIENSLIISGAYDINQYRHITVRVESNEGMHLGVLTSAADFNGDLKVDGTDRTDPFNNYCSTCDADHLVYDLNCDGVVNSSDLAIVTALYSGTSLVTIPAICECESGFESSMTSAPMDEESVLAGLGFASWDALSDWMIAADSAAADSVCETLALLLHGS